MLEKRLSAFELFEKLPLPKWGPDLTKLDLSKIVYYIKPTARQAGKWEDVPQNIKKTFDALGIPELEQKSMAGAGAQYESSGIYHHLKHELKQKGVIFEDMDTAVRKHEKLVKYHFMKAVAPSLHKFAALHNAVWSGGSFLYIPKGVKLNEPVHSYFRMESRGMGQFEHTLIIAEEGSDGHYIEGCSAPKWGIDSLHAGCVEIFVGAKSRFRYSSIENWSRDVYNLNTKRAIVEAGGKMEWVGGNFGSAVAMLYPCSVLKGKGANADHLGLSFASNNQIHDTGAKIICAAPKTSAKIISRSVSKNGGSSLFRGDIRVLPAARDAKIQMKCDGLIMDAKSRNIAEPLFKIQNQTAHIVHEARSGKINEEDLFYLRSRGLGEDDANALVVNGFSEPIARELPMEYALEMNRMIELALKDLK